MPTSCFDVSNIHDGIEEFSETSLQDSRMVNTSVEQHVSLALINTGAVVSKEQAIPSLPLGVGSVDRPIAVASVTLRLPTSGACTYSSRGKAGPCNTGTDDPNQYLGGSTRLSRTQCAGSPPLARCLSLIVFLFGHHRCRHVSLALGHDRHHNFRLWLDIWQRGNLACSSMSSASFLFSSSSTAFIGIPLILLPPALQ